MKKNLYTVWHWNDAPYAIRAASPIDEGSWIVRVEPGHGFSHNEMHVSKYPEWEVKVRNLDGRWYTFIKAPGGQVQWQDFDTDWLEPTPWPRPTRAARLL